MAAWFHKRRHDPCMHLTLKLLPWLCISIMFDSIHLSSMRSEMQAWKENSIIFMHLEYDRLFCSYLRVNQVSWQVIACVTINACPFSTEKPLENTNYCTFFQHLSSTSFGNLKNAFSGKEECIFYAFFSWNTVDIYPLYKTFPHFDCQYL